MSLLLPPWYFAHCADNLDDGGTPAAASVGTNFTAGANSTDAAAVSVLSALAHDAHFLVINIGGIGTANVDNAALLTVLIDPAGGTSWTTLIPYLICGGSTALSGTVPPSANYAFPLWIPAGASIGVRARTAHTANITTGYVTMWAFGEPSRPDMWWCGQGVEAVGISDATSKGANVPTGNAVWGSWNFLGITGTTKRYGAIQLGINNASNLAATAGYFFQLGLGSQRLPGSPTIYRSMTSSENGTRAGQGIPIWCDVPAGVLLYARGMCSGSGDSFNAAAYGVY